MKKNVIRSILFGRRTKHQELTSRKIVHKNKRFCPFCENNNLIRLRDGLWECEVCGDLILAEEIRYKNTK